LTWIGSLKPYDSHHGHVFVTSASLPISSDKSLVIKKPLEASIKSVKEKHKLVEIYMVFQAY
jgi:hypothetical protein